MWGRGFSPARLQCSIGLKPIHTAAGTSRKLVPGFGYGPNYCLVCGTFEVNLEEQAAIVHVGTQLGRKAGELRLQPCTLAKAQAIAGAEASFQIIDSLLLGQQFAGFTLVQPSTGDALLNRCSNSILTR